MTLRVTPQQLVDDAERSGTPGLLARAPGWGRVRLDRVARVINGAPFSSRLFNKDGRGFPLIRIRDVATSEVSTWYDGPFDDLHVVELGALLVGMDGDFRVARWRGPTGLLNQRVCRLEVNTELYDERLLALVLQGYLDAIWKATSSVTVKHLSSRSVAEIPLPLPPRDEQRRIVDILEDHLSRLDAASTYLRTVLERSALMRAAVLHAAATGRLTSTDSGGPSRAELLAQRRVLCPPGMRRGRPEPAAPDGLGTTLDIPERWTLMSLEEVTDPVRTISYGILKPGPDIEGGVPYVRVLNMRDNRLDVANLHRTTPEIAAAYGRASLIGGDLLVSIRGTYGRVVHVPESLAGANITQDTARLAFTEGVLPEFARIYLMSPVAQRHMKRVARGVAVKGVNIADLRAMPFPVPPAEEQTRIVERAEELLSDLADAERTATSGLRRSTSLRRALLDAAFSGRLTGASSDLDRVEELAGV